MSELRRHTRKQTSHRVIIFDLSSQESIGSLINISVSGLMLMTDQKLHPGHIFQLEMTLPGQAGEIHTIAFGAESLWIQKISSSDHSWVGLQIIDMAESDIALIGQLIQDWKE
ncbi:MAG: PilZ domain-containing protein [Sedimenticola sp.]